MNDLGFPLEPDNGPLKGVLIAFRIGEDDKPIDIDKNRYKKARRSFFKSQAKEEKKEEVEEKEEEADKEEDLSESLEVHLNGLPYEVTEEEIRQFFAGCGKIEEVRLSRYERGGIWIVATRTRIAVAATDLSVFPLARM